MKRPIIPSKKSRIFFRLYKQDLSPIRILEKKIVETETTQKNADDFIRAMKKYFDAPELTREMCYELIDRIIIGGTPRATGKDREINIVYKIDIASVLRHRLKNRPQKP